ncbi:MAG: UDP-N-acetylmuramoyl-L-alanine--D-glutamate ligase [Candidatus Kerfeldbacteria bacterium]|nr:UDP-N-acetylmuramoyl-L-alanine--D-glutamate ligase [Candidatus Kerfeldbacteria bacterium]
MSVPTRPVIIRPRLFGRFPELIVGGGIVWQGQRRFAHATGRRAVNNRIVFYQTLGARSSGIVFGQQVHGRRVALVSGNSAKPRTFVASTDGLVTKKLGQSLGLYSADCIPVVAYDPVHRIVGVAHAGWRGLVRGVVQNLIQTMVACGAAPRALLVWLGPSAGPCCYDVTEKRDRRVHQFMKRFGNSTVVHRAGRVFLDLRRAATLELVSAGVLTAQLEVSRHCTIHSRWLLPSARRQKSDRRHSFVVIAGLRDPLESLKGKRVLVVGLGLHGGAASAVEWFVKHGAHVCVTDRKNARQLAPTLRQLRELPVRYRLGGHHREDIHWADLVYQNQSVPSSIPELRLARKLRKPIVNEWSLFLRFCPARIIGITGTRGKSTVAWLLYQIMRPQLSRVVLSGNIAQKPMLSVLDRLSKQDYVILELSSFQLEFSDAVARSPQVAVMTNLLVDHLDRYQNMSAYAAAKYRMFQYQNPRDIAVLNYDSRPARLARHVTGAKILWWSQRERPPGWSIYLQKGKLVERHGTKSTTIIPKLSETFSTTALQANVIAAVSAARAVRIPIATIRRALRGFRLLPHRQELVRRWRGHSFVNDSSATTPDATLAAVEAFPDGLFIVGGTDKRLNFRALAKTFARRTTPLVLLPGTATRKLIRALRRFGYHGRLRQVASMPVAVRQAIKTAQVGQSIILSPGAASFGLFQHEFDRGDQFRTAVIKLRS